MTSHPPPQMEASKQSPSLTKEQSRAIKKAKKSAKKDKKKEEKKRKSTGDNDDDAASSTKKSKTTATTPTLTAATTTDRLQPGEEGFAKTESIEYLQKWEENRSAWKFNKNPGNLIKIRKV